MNTTPHPQALTSAALRTAFGPGYQFVGASAYSLRTFELARTISLGAAR